MANLWTQFWLSFYIISVRNVAKLKPHTVLKIFLREMASAPRKGWNTEIGGGYCDAMSQVGTDCQDTADAVGFEIQNHAKSRSTQFFFRFSTTPHSFFRNQILLRAWKCMPQKGYKKMKRMLDPSEQIYDFLFCQIQVSHLFFFRGSKQIFIV